MTIAALRSEYNRAFRENQLEVFFSKLMPKVFTLLEHIGDQNNSLPHEVQHLASDCCTVKVPEGKPADPNRYTGGK